MINSDIHSKINEGSHAFANGLLGNSSLAVLKLSVGLFGYSKLILMDGVFSFTNAVALLLMWQADRLDKKEANEKYPYGYGKAVFLIMSVTGAVVLIIAIYMFFYSLMRMAWLEIHRSHGGAMMVALISVIGNEILCRYLRDEAKSHSNNIIAWNAVNNRINVLVSSLILFFILFASLGASYLERIGVAVISMIMLFTSLRILYMAFSGIMDKLPHQKVLNQIKSYACKIKGVKDVLNIKARYVGTLLYLDLCIAVDENLTMEDADKIVRDVEAKLIKKISFIKEANVIIA